VTLGVFARLRRYSRSVEDSPSTAMLSYFVYLARGESRVYKNWPGVESGQGQEHGGEGAAILANDHHAIAGSNLQASQPSFSF
jgi:hypothetical protein